MTLTTVTIDEFLGNYRLLHADKIAGLDITDLLGDALKQWLNTMLNDKNIEETPIIHGKIEEGAIVEGPVYIEEGAHVEATALVRGPCYIARDAVVRHGAYIRGHAYIGPKAVVGHCTEVKGSIFLDDAKAGHFAYVGDAILGPNCNLGAGTKIANLKLNKSNVRIKLRNGQLIDSGLRKFGAIVGADVSTGCNSVLSPGSLLYPSTMVLPCAHFHGTIEKGLAR